MPEEALQAAFEIKTACDEISRRLLRWHWEHKPGAHSLGALLDHVAQRQQESPDYYDRMPDLSGKNSWQQLDTTICMRVLLDPEKDAAKPLDLLETSIKKDRKIRDPFLFGLFLGMLLGSLAILHWRLTTPALELTGKMGGFLVTQRGTDLAD